MSPMPTTVAPMTIARGWRATGMRANKPRRRPRGRPSGLPLTKIVSNAGVTVRLAMSAKNIPVPEMMPRSTIPA